MGLANHSRWRGWVSRRGSQRKSLIPRQVSEPQVVIRDSEKAVSIHRKFPHSEWHPCCPPSLGQLDYGSTCRNINPDALADDQSGVGEAFGNFFQHLSRG